MRRQLHKSSAAITPRRAPFVRICGTRRTQWATHTIHITRSELPQALIARRVSCRKCMGIPTICPPCWATTSLADAAKYHVSPCALLIWWTSLRSGIFATPRCVQSDSRGQSAGEGAGGQLSCASSGTYSDVSAVLPHLRTLLAIPAPTQRVLAFRQVVR